MMLAILLSVVLSAAASPTTAIVPAPEGRNSGRDLQEVLTAAAPPLVENDARPWPLAWRRSPQDFATWTGTSGPEPSRYDQRYVTW